MQVLKLSDFTKGWVVGDFEPSIIRTKEVEVSVRFYDEGYTEPAHVHKVATEITIIHDGVYDMNGTMLKRGDVMVLNPGDPTAFKCIEAGSNTVIKMPSVIGDKYLV